jgi:transcription elongation factor GreA-like protein
MQLSGSLRARKARRKSDRIAPTATSLGNYFVTSAGANLIETLESALRQARDTGKPLVIT